MRVSCCRLGALQANITKGSSSMSWEPYMLGMTWPPTWFSIPSTITTERRRDTTCWLMKRMAATLMVSQKNCRRWARGMAGFSRCSKSEPPSSEWIRLSVTARLGLAATSWRQVSLVMTSWPSGMPWTWMTSVWSAVLLWWMKLRSSVFETWS